MLEIYTSIDDIMKYIDDIDRSILYLTNIFSYLISRKYFKQIRRLIEKRVPPLDEPVTIPPNPASEIILTMLLRPLKLVKDLNSNLK